MSVFRERLLEISDSLVSPELKKLKYICIDCIPEGKAEKIEDAFELFLALEHGGKLSPKYRDFLASKLIAINRIDLKNKLLEIEGKPVKVNTLR